MSGKRWLGWKFFTKFHATNRFYSREEVNEKREMLQNSSTCNVETLAKNNITLGFANFSSHECSSGATLKKLLINTGENLSNVAFFYHLTFWVK